MKSVVDVLHDLELELLAANKKFPGNDDNFMALTEEFGELAQALIQQKHEPVKGKDDADIYTEAIQTACVALKIAMSGDSNFPDYDPDKGYLL